MDSIIISIDAKKIGRGKPCFIIAEVGQAHDGSLGLAHSFIDAAAYAGVDAIKFQTHIAHAESTYDETWRIQFSYEDATRFDYWNRISFNEDQWAQLAKHARDKGLIFLSTAFSLEAYELLTRLNIPAWKVASGELLSNLMIDKFIESGKPLLISSGMSTWDELKSLARKLRASNAKYCFLQCTSKYPTDIVDVGLNVIEEMRQNLGPIVGLSDHTGNLDVLKTAVARGANLVEAHITFDKQMFGPDSSSSLTVSEFKDLVDYRKLVFTLDSNAVNKDQVANELLQTRSLFMRSVALKADAKAGTVLTSDMLTLKKPANGIPESDLSSLFGRTLAKDVTARKLLKKDDLLDE